MFRETTLAGEVFIIYRAKLCLDALTRQLSSQESSALQSLAGSKL